MLQSYCEDRLDSVSSKGNEATLAARIARAWSKPDFEPLPLKNDGAAADDDDELKACCKQDGAKKKESSLKNVNDSTKKKRSGEKKDNNNQKCGDKEKEESLTKKRKVWVSAETQPSETITVPPGPLEDLQSNNTIPITLSRKYHPPVPSNRGKSAQGMSF